MCGNECYDCRVAVAQCKIKRKVVPRNSAGACTHIGLYSYMMPYYTCITTYA